jgi:hypothetical protein
MERGSMRTGGTQSRQTAVGIENRKKGDVVMSQSSQDLLNVNIDQIWPSQI